MHRKKILLVSDESELLGRLKNALAEIDTEVGACATAALASTVGTRDVDLVVLDAAGRAAGVLDDVERMLTEVGSIGLIALIDAADLPSLRLPVRLSADFMLIDGSDGEFVARVRHLLWPGEEAGSDDFVTVDRLTINLATYQVHIDGAPIDLTYLEYALLAFLVTHPGRTYSRDALLRRVWGFEYYGGSRTVDVHVRRIRAKLGPEMSQRLETIRGVGYLWTA